MAWGKLRLRRLHEQAVLVQAIEVPNVGDGPVILTIRRWKFYANPLAGRELRRTEKAHDPFLVACNDACTHLHFEELALPSHSNLGPARGTSPGNKSKQGNFDYLRLLAFGLDPQYL